MDTKTLTLGIFLLIHLTSCKTNESRQQQELNPTRFAIATNTSEATVTISPSPFITSSLTRTATPTARMIHTPRITATPINEEIQTYDDLRYLLEKLYPMTTCTYNLLAPGAEEMAGEHNLEFIETGIKPDPTRIRISEIADNLDKNRQAFVAGELYVSDYTTEKTFEISWSGRMPNRIIERIIWINNDVLVFFQSTNPWIAQVVAIDFVKQDYIYHSIVYANSPCVTLTP